VVLPEGRTAEQRIEAGRGLRYLPGGWLRLSPGRDAERIGVDYPAGRLHWLAWFVLISMAAAWVFRRRFRVAL
jgi:hypothetical protein